MHKLNKYILYLGMIFYTLQGPYLYTYFFIISFLLITVAFNFKFSNNNYFVLISIIIIIYTLLGLLNRNPSIIIEFKNWLFWILSLNIGLLIFKYLKTSEIISLLSFSVITLLIIYVLLDLKIIPNLYLKEELASYHDYKTVGPYIVTPILYQLFFLVKKLPITKKYWFISICSIAIVLISGSLQYLLIILIGIIINTVTLNLKKIIYFIGLSILLVFAVLKFVGDKQLDKILQISNPLESPTVQTRISDVSYAYNKNDSNPIIGNGLGVRSSVERVSVFDYRLVDTRDFLEVDNGFYYIYHRMGVLGLFMFLLFVLQLQKNLSIKEKSYFSLFIVITCLLSIHLFTVNMFAIIFSFFIFNSQNGKKKYIFSK